MRLHPGEPEFGPYQPMPVVDVAAYVRRLAGTPQGRPAIVAVDGRSAGGKTSTSAVLAAAIDGAAVVHTDDIAWWHSFFGWSDLMIDGVLRPLHAGEAVSYRPPGWVERGREGAVAVPVDASVVLIEGVGASRQDFGGLLDAAVWVQSDADEAFRRAIPRDMANEGRSEEDVIRFWGEWQAEEAPFLAADRPWDRAGLVVLGTPPADLQKDLLLVSIPGGPDRRSGETRETT